MTTTTEAKKFPLKRTEAFHRKEQILDKNGDYSVKYNLILCLRPSTIKNSQFPENDFEGRMDIKFTYYDEKQEDIFLNFCGTVHSIIINDVLTEINYKDKRIYLSHSDLICGSINHVIILFSTKYGTSGAGLHHFIDPTDKKEYLYTQFEPYDCNLVFPVFDQPNIKANLKLTLAGPEDWVLLGNGKEICTWKLTKDTKNDDKDIEYINEILSPLSNDEYEFLFKSIFDNNYKITIFEETPKISSYLYAICAGPYITIYNPYNYEIPMRVFMRESLKKLGEPKELFRITISGMEFYKKFFGIAFQFSKYDQIFCPEYNYGAMENVGLVTFNEEYLYRISGNKGQQNMENRSKFCITVLHELAHMWFGDLVTMNWWDDLWLNESFATIISFVCQNDALGNDYKNTWIAFNNMKGYGYSEDQKSTTHSVYSDIKDTDESDSHFDGIVYYKGSSLVKQMLYVIGKENFSNGLKEYFKLYKWKNTCFNDFINKMDEQLKIYNNKNNIKNEFELKDLCKKWLTEEGLTQLEPIWEIENNKIKYFKIKQNPCDEKHNNLQNHIFNIKLIYDENDDNKNIIQKIFVLPQNETIFKEFENKPAPNAIFLNYGDYGYFKNIMDNKSVNYFKENLIKRLPDNLSRQMFYLNLYDLVRDAKIPCKEYLDIVSKFLLEENDNTIINTVLTKSLVLIKNYLPIKIYPEYSDKMFNLIQKLIIKNKNNNQLIISCCDYLINFAYSEKNILQLKTWLDNDKPYVNIDNEKFEFNNELLNQNNRFSICDKIYTLNSLSLEEKEKILKKEQEKDKNSDRAKRAEYKCKASLPDEKIKEEIWKLITENSESTSLKNLQSYMGGFQPISQLNLVEKYVKNLFFDVIIKLQKKDIFFIEYFIYLCGPIKFTDDETIKKVLDLAETVKDSSVCHRCLLELADDMKRFKKARDLNN